MEAAQTQMQQEMSEVDRLKWQLAGERRARAAASAEVARLLTEKLLAEESALLKDLRERYQLGDSDEVDIATGAITRRPPPEPLHEVPPERRAS